MKEEAMDNDKHATTKDTTTETYALLEVDKNNLEAFVICLALGTLREMRDGNIPYETGIWTLGRPIFCRVPEIESLLSDDVLKVLQHADEIDAMEKLAGKDRTLQWLDEMIATLQSRLKALEAPYWYARWSGERIDSE